MQIRCYRLKISFSVTCFLFPLTIPWFYCCSPNPRGLSLISLADPPKPKPGNSGCSFALCLIPGDSLFPGKSILKYCPLTNA